MDDPYLVSDTLPCCGALWLLICGLWGLAVAAPKRAGWTGFFLGVSLGPFGVIAAALLDGRPGCPVCGTRLPLRQRERGRETADGYSHCPGCKMRLEWYRGDVSLAENQRRGS